MFPGKVRGRFPKKHILLDAIPNQTQQRGGVIV
jgi:hypothetical protein